MLLASTSPGVLAAALSAGAVAIAGLGGGWFAARRLNSGKVGTSDATTLWTEAEKLRVVYREEAVQLRLEATQLRHEAQTLRDEAFDLREEAQVRRHEAVQWRQEAAELRSEALLRRTESAALRLEVKDQQVELARLREAIARNAAPTSGSVPPKDLP